MNSIEKARRQQRNLWLSLGMLCCLSMPAAVAVAQVNSAGALINFGDPNFQVAVQRPLSQSGSSWSSVFRWMHIGDSHTAGDYFSGELRQS